MAVFEVVEGPPGQGKSVYTARKARFLLRRNKKIFDRLHKKRRVASNQKFSELFEAEHGLCTCPPHAMCVCEGWIIYWQRQDDLVLLRDVDVIWDECANILESRNWQNLSPDMLVLLSQYRKRGIDFYCNTQDFSMVDARARIMITSVKTLNKVLGSPDISTTKPPPKVIWGFIWVRSVLNWKETNPEKKKYSLVDLLSWIIIERELTDIFNTRQEIPRPPALPYKHEVRVCELHGASCDYSRVLHT